MNTVLLVEPRKISYIYNLLKKYQDILGKMNYVFFCGKSNIDYWKINLNNLKYKVDLYPLPVDNMIPNEYNDFMKRKDLWTYLKGKFVLVIQADTWINPSQNNKKNLNYFINLNKSYIGGNFYYKWNELHRENIYLDFYNFNGGLSLRNRLDMIKVIDTFPPQLTINDSKKLETDAEDVYFTIGCIKLGLKVGDNEDCSSFALHETYYTENLFDNFFGIHKPSHSLISHIPNNIKKTFYYLHKIAIINGLPFHYEMFGYVIEYCIKNSICLDIYTETTNNMGWFDFYNKEFQDSFNILPLSNFSPKNTYMKVILLTDDDPFFNKNWNTENIICIDHYHENRNSFIIKHIGTRYFISRPELEWVLPVYRQIDLYTKKKIEKNNMLFIGGNARYMINSEYIDQIKKQIHCIFIDRYINNIDTIEMMNLLKESKYVFISYNNKNHIDKSMSASIPLALNSLCTIIMPKKMNEIYKLKSVIEYDENNLNLIKLKHNPSLVDKDLSYLLSHKIKVFNNIFFD